MFNSSVRLFVLVCVFVPALCSAVPSKLTQPEGDLAIQENETISSRFGLYGKCFQLGRGFLVFNHRSSTIHGANFAARLTCSRNVPTYIVWKGGALCLNGWFYGRNGLGQPFSCLVRSIRYR